MKVFFQTMFLGLFACSEPKTDTATSDTAADTAGEEINSVYGSCSLELVAASGYDYTASSIGAASVSIHLSYIDDTHGVQEELHPMTSMESNSSNDTWSLELENVYNPEDVVLGESSMWSVTGFTEGDKLFLAMTENNEVCDCWDTNWSETIIKDCTDFGAEE